MTARHVPVIVGVGQITDTTTPPDRARSRVDMMADACRLALADSGGQPSLLADVNSIVVVRSFPDSSPRFKSPYGTPANPAWSLSKRLGVTARELVHTSIGGNMPQVALSRACDLIAAGDHDAVLIAGAEVLRTELLAKRSGHPLDWSEEAPSPATDLGVNHDSASEYESIHLMDAPISVYPIFEQALRGALFSDVSTHLSKVGRLMERMASVAGRNPLAARPSAVSAESLVTPDDENPFICYPYTKLLNAHVFVDQAAALLVCSSGIADRCGVPISKRVYLHGASEGRDHWHFSERPFLYASLPIRRVVQQTLEMAERTLSEVGVFDLYSCFPSAVEIACREIGIQADDPRELTVTGGLPYFGGPGNNYVTHSIAETVSWARTNPGAFGLVTANGNVLTKHAAGLYSTLQPRNPWRRDNPSGLQEELDRQPKLSLCRHPFGPARIEAYTVMHDRAGPSAGLIVGRLTATNERFLANSPPDLPDQLEALRQRDSLNAKGHVYGNNGRNLFVLEDPG